MQPTLDFDREGKVRWSCWETLQGNERLKKFSSRLVFVHKTKTDQTNTKWHECYTRLDIHNINLNQRSRSADSTNISYDNGTQEHMSGRSGPKMPLHYSDLVELSEASLSVSVFLLDWLLCLRHVTGLMVSDWRTYLTPSSKDRRNESTMSSM